MARSGLAGRGVPPGGQPVAHRHAVDLVACIGLGLGLGMGLGLGLGLGIGLGLGLGLGLGSLCTHPRRV